MLQRFFLFAVLASGMCMAAMVLGNNGRSAAKSNEKPPLIILLGAPGSGKGTLAGSIVKDYGVVHISTGDMFRENIKSQTPIGKKAKSYIDAGQLVPDEVVIDMLRARLEKPDCQHGALLDGFPRTLAQAEALEPIINHQYTPVVLSLEVSDKTVLDRLTGRRYCPSCNAVYNVTFSPPKKEGVCDVCNAPLAIRPDDTEATVRERLAVFHKQIGPLKEHYAKKGLLDEINGEIGAQLRAQACKNIIKARLEKKN